MSVDDLLRLRAQCRHLHADYTMRDGAVIFGCYNTWCGEMTPQLRKHQSHFGYEPGRVVSARCAVCGEQLSLGPANDDHAAWNAGWAPIDDLIANSSIGRGLANIKANGIDAELADLEAEMAAHDEP